MLTNLDLQNGTADVKLHNGGKGQYRIVQSPQWVDIIFITENDWKYIGGPYLNKEEAIDDFMGVIDIHYGKQKRKKNSS